MWQTLLARESVATIMGALLLILFVIAYLIALLLGVETTQIVDSAFLLVLGYFFGQMVSRAQSQPKSPQRLAVELEGAKAVLIRYITTTEQ